VFHGVSALKNSEAIMKKVLVAGATGYLGRYLIKELKKQGHWIRALARDRKKLYDLANHIDEIIEGDVIRPESIPKICSGIDIIISSIGITRQKNGLTYMDVDYQANVNLLIEANKSGVEKFIYVSVLNAHLMPDLKIIQAKTRFEEALRISGLKYMIIRPNGFFSDMIELLNMARKGTVYLFGEGEYKGNPIHGEDLAEFIVSTMDSNESELEVGGPDLLSQNQMAELAFAAVGKAEKIRHIPLWIRNVVLKLVRLFSGQKTYGPIEFFMTVMAMDMMAPQKGHHHLADYYSKIVREEKVQG
jgi:uncharacterized protein YbjT (DUF2867 family)